MRLEIRKILEYSFVPEKLKPGFIFKSVVMGMALNSTTPSNQ